MRTKLRLLVLVTAIATGIACAGNGGGGGRGGNGGSTGGGAGGGGGAAGGGGAPGSAPVALDGPLPTSAVDATLFPKNLASRYQVAGRTFYVAPSGDDAAAGTQAAPWKTVARGIEAASASAGNRVVVAAGTYAEGDPADFVALRIAREGTVLQAAPGGGAVTVTPSGPGITYGLEVTASRVTVSGVSFDGFTTGIHLGVQGTTVRDIVIADLTVAMSAQGGGDGIASYPDNRIVAGRPPVVDGLLVERVTVAGADQGITIGNGPGRSIALRDVVVRNRGAAGGGSGADAIAVEDGDNILVNGADVSGAEADGIDLKATRVAVLNVHVHGVLRNGVKLWSGGDIVNALIHDTGADAAVVLVEPATASGPPHRYRIVNTVVAFHNRLAGGGSAYAMSVGYDGPLHPIELELANVVFYRNTGGIVLSKGTRATVRSCAFFGAANGQVFEYAYDGSSSASIDESMAVAELAKLGAASGNLPFATDPRFADANAAALDGFRPAAQSPLKNAGIVAAPFPAVDLTGAPRSAGGAPDLGPLESR